MPKRVRTTVARPGRRPSSSYGPFGRDRDRRRSPATAGSRPAGFLTHFCALPAGTGQPTELPPVIAEMKP